MTEPHRPRYLPEHPRDSDEPVTISLEEMSALAAKLAAQSKLIAEAREALAVCGALIVAEQLAPPIHNFEIEARKAARAKCEEIIGVVLAKLKAASGEG